MYRVSIVLLDRALCEGSSESYSRRFVMNYLYHSKCFSPSNPLLLFFILSPLLFCLFVVDVVVFSLVFRFSQTLNLSYGETYSKRANLRNKETHGHVFVRTIIPSVAKLAVLTVKNRHCGLKTKLGLTGDRMIFIAMIFTVRRLALSTFPTVQ